MADSISASTTVVGVKDALRVLNSIDKQARRDLTKDFKQITAPVTNDIKAKLPKSARATWQTAGRRRHCPRPRWRGRRTSDA